MDGQVVRRPALAPGGRVGVHPIQRIAQALQLSITEGSAHHRDATGTDPAQNAVRSLPAVTDVRGRDL